MRAQRDPRPYGLYHHGRGAAGIASILALVWTSALAGCTGAPDLVLGKFGLVGTFSDDCSKPIEEGGARAIYEVPAVGGYPTFTAVNKYGTFRSQIERTDQVNADRLTMYVVHPDGAWDKIDIQKEGSKFRTIEMVAYKRNALRPSVTVDTTRAAGSGADGLVLEKCSH